MFFADDHITFQSKFCQFHRLCCGEFKNPGLFTTVFSMERSLLPEIDTAKFHNFIYFLCCSTLSHSKTPTAFSPSSLIGGVLSCRRFSESSKYRSGSLPSMFGKMEPST